MDMFSYQIGKNSAPQPSGSLSITENGTYDVTEKASAVVNVQGGQSGLPIEIASSCPSPFLLNQNNLTSNVKYIFPTTIANVQKVGGSVIPYISSSGTQWIDTGYIPKANTKIVLKYVRNGTQSDESIFGTNWNLNSFFLMHYSGNLRWHGKSSSVDIPESSLTGIRQLSVYGTNITVNGTSYTLSGSGNDTQSDTLRIFGVRGNSIFQPTGQLKLYELKIYEYNSSTSSFDLVKNYVPAQSQESGHENEACLYETETETYFYNQGTGTFTWGEDIAPVTKVDVGDEVKTKLSPTNDYANFNYQWQNAANIVPVITSTGTQYINTGIIPTNHEVVAKFQYTEATNNSCIFGVSASSYHLTWYSSKWFYACGNGERSFNGTQCTDLQVVDFNNANQKIVMNDVEYASTNGTVSISGNLTIFGRGGASTQSKAKLYYLKIYDRSTNTLVRDFVPAISQESGHENAVCLYDNVTQTYFYNQGSGVFVYEQEGDFTDISGETSSTYVTQTGDNAVRCILTGTGNAEGTITSSIIEVQEVD